MLKIQKEIMQDQVKYKSEKVLLSHVSHRIRTPLNSVIGFSKLLLNKSVDNQKTREFAKRILDSGYEILHYFQNIMDLSEIESGMVSPHPEDFELNQSLSELTSEFKIRFQNERNIRLKYVYPSENEYCRLYSDNSVLRRIIGNLIEITQHIITTGEIKISYEEKEGNNIHIYVNGISENTINQTLQLSEPQDSYNVIDPDSLEYLTYKATQKLSFLIKGKFELAKKSDSGILFKVKIPKEISKIEKMSEH